MGGNSLIKGTQDLSTNAIKTVAYEHHEIHEGNKFFVSYSVASLGAMTTPDDMISLNWITPNTTKWGHFQFLVSGTSGWRIRLIEAPTGGAATATGNLDILNQNRNSAKVSTFTSLTPTAAKIDYDATLATGGITLYDDYIAGSTTRFTGLGNIGPRDEIILKQNTRYQLSLYGTDTDPGTLRIDWYEHTNKS